MQDVINFLTKRFQDRKQDEIEGAIADLNLEAVSRIASERFVFSLWEGEAINGAEYNEMLDLGMPFGGGESFVIRDLHAGRVVYFQTFDPDLSGYQPMSEERAIELGLAMRENMAKSSFLETIAKRVAEKLK